MTGRTRGRKLLYLASRSPRRRRLIRSLGRPYRIVSSDYRETGARRGTIALSARPRSKDPFRLRLQGLPPPRSLRSRGVGRFLHSHVVPGSVASIVMRHAAGKARLARLPRRARGLVIGADTVVYRSGRLLGKPRTLSQARRMLRWLSGRPHWVYTGLCVRDIETGRETRGYAKTRVTFRSLDLPAIEALMAAMRPLDKAGAYALQHDGEGRLISRIDGSRSNVIGLPLELLRRRLRRLEGAPRKARRC
ncbi:MAG TPA: Maf family protein [bacterium]